MVYRASAEDGENWMATLATLSIPGVGIVAPAASPIGTLIQITACCSEVGIYRCYNVMQTKLHAVIIAHLPRA